MNNITDKQLTEKIAELKETERVVKQNLTTLEEELKKRKNKTPLGVPVQLNEDGDIYLLDIGGTVCRCRINSESTVNKYLALFDTHESAEKHSEMLLAWRKALVANSKGEPIDIEAIRYLLPKGWTCCTEYGRWLYSAEKPRFERTCIIDRWQFKGSYYQIDAFNIKPAKDWRKSLMGCGL